MHETVDEKIFDSEVLFGRWGRETREALCDLEEVDQKVTFIQDELVKLEGLAGQCPLDDALMRYEHRRNEATMAEYRENIEAARFTPISPELLQLRLALRGNQEDTNRFVMALEGWISQEKFFDPENLKRIFANAAESSVQPNHPVAAAAHLF